MNFKSAKNYNCAHRQRGLWPSFQDYDHKVKRFIALKAIVNLPTAIQIAKLK